MYFDGINPIRVMKYDLDLFWKFYPAALIRMAYVKVTKKKLRSKIFGGGKIVYNQNVGNEILKEALKGNEPFMFGRHGVNEVFIALHGMLLENGVIENMNSGKLEVACMHSGFFPNTQENYIKFNKLIIDASSQCDLYGTLRMTGEDYYRNLLGGLYRENPVKSRNYEAVKSSKKWENVGNSYIIPALLLYRYSYI